MKHVINLFQNATVGLFVIKLPAGEIVHANASSARILGYDSLDSLVAGFSWQKHFSFTDLGEAFDRPLGLGTAEHWEMRILRADGTSGWVTLSFGVYLITGHLHGILVDISDRKRLEAEIITISDLEREKFGRELHDVLGQTLTGTAFLCRAMMQRLPSEPTGLEGSLVQVENLVNEALVQARHLAHGLSYADVGPAGIGARLKQLAVQVNALFGVICSAEAASRVVLPDRESAIHLYRIAQESVYNAVKHSGSPRVEIRLEKKGADDGILTVEDFGKGLPKRIPRTKGIGMRLMKLRARLMGASVRVMNKTERGVRVTCVFPLAKRNVA